MANRNPLDPETEDEYARIRELHDQIRTEANLRFLTPGQNTPMQNVARVIGGCDPGAKGAICTYDLETGRLVMYDMPLAHVDVGRGRNSRARNVTSAVKLGAIVRAMDPMPDVMWLEDVAARPGQGVSSMFTFGRAVGVVEGVMGGLGIPVYHVAPRVWMREFRVIGKSALHDGGAGRRPNSRYVAGAAFPEYAGMFQRVKDDGRADAALIALYGAKHANGTVVGKYRGESLTVGD
jgi:crossover junction endodeoxyribonuclease RuvC